MGNIIQEGNRLFFLSNYSHVEYFRRNANMTAYTLREVALFRASPHCYNDIPACILPVIMNEMNKF